MANFSAKTSLVALWVFIVIVISGVFGIGISLLLGIVYALVIGNQFQIKTQWAAGLILKTSIVLLGFAINVTDVYETARDGFVVTLVTILFALIVGYLIGLLFRVEKPLAFLVSSGTAICGGSAIAAVAPAINAKPNHVIISITIVFLLNAIGLIIFPGIGQYLGLSQNQFGLWAALAIHDTSSVVGAAGAFGEEALKVATTTKLARALWIIPLALVASVIFNQNRRSVSIPVFIVFFVLASGVTSFFNLPVFLEEMIPALAKTGMALALFLIGAGFSKATLSGLQWGALWQGVVLWILVSLFSLWLVIKF
ncbi:putative sulfate exporter family transporter [Aliikangiella marina]|uniref:Putative sulfate exporter family transporter n=1 Tax=Aliikangiella marina TaxID=1712262 RepID=A0A545T355_9GAMM|nr:putative sulfate exporter family transporter [Aliikangiella marina]TQV71625.1 putative sulfate exporter family transporter [Aliikangiella marina]